MAKTDEDKQLALNARASKLWRTLRIASKSKLSLFDKIDDGNNLQALFQPENEENRSKEDIQGSEQQVIDATQTPTLMEAEQMPVSGNGLDLPAETMVK